MLMPGFYYDGQNTITTYLNGRSVATSVVTDLPTHAGHQRHPVSNGTAAAQTMSIDYVFALQANGKDQRP